MVEMKKKNKKDNNEGVLAGYPYSNFYHAH